MPYNIQKGGQVDDKAIASKIVEGMPYQCRIETSTEYSVTIPESLHLHHSRLYANCAELSRREDISGVSVSHYNHRGNCVYTIEVAQNYEIDDGDDSNNWGL